MNVIWHAREVKKKLRASFFWAMYVIFLAIHPARLDHKIKISPTSVIIPFRLYNPNKIRRARNQ